MKKVLLPLAVIALVVIALIFYFNSGKTDSTNSEEDKVSELAQTDDDVFANCTEITPEKYLELIKACRTSEETEMGLPFNLKFGMSRQEYKDGIVTVAKKSGLSDVDFKSLDDNLGFDFRLEKAMLHLNPIFFPEDSLYQLEMTISPTAAFASEKNLVREMMNFYIGDNTKYNSFEKYTEDHKLFYFIKGNQLVVPDLGKGVLFFTNVPRMPEALYKEAIGE